MFISKLVLVKPHVYHVKFNSQGCYIYYDTVGNSHRFVDENGYTSLTSSIRTYVYCMRVIFNNYFITNQRQVI
jgi:hypothetical protein